MKLYKNIPFLIVIYVLLTFVYGFKISMVFIFSYLMHELFHILAIYHYKMKIISISLIPFGGQIRYDGGVDCNPKIDLIIYSSGPFINLVLVIIGYVFSFKELISINISLALFNLLPAIPLDGFYITLNTFSLKIPYYFALKISLCISLITAIGLFIISLFINLYLMFLSIYIVIISIKAFIRNDLYKTLLLEKIALYSNENINYEIKPHINIKYIIYKGCNTYFKMNNTLYFDRDLLKK